MVLEFQCRQCKIIFSAEEQSSFREFSEKWNAKHITASDMDTALVEFLIAIKQNVRCPQCQSLCDLLDISNKKVSQSDTAKSGSLDETIKRLVDIHAEYKSKTTVETFLNYSGEVPSLARKTTEYIMWHPGTLVYFADAGLRDQAKSAIDELWSAVAYDDLADGMYSGGFSGLLVNIIGDYIDKVQMIKPTLIAVDANVEIKTYFQEAMNSWCHGLNTAALILSCSILEAILKQVLLRRNPRLVYNSGSGANFKEIKEKDFCALIDNAKKENLLTPYEAGKAHNIRNMRNDAVHKLKQFTSNDTHQAIITTKELLEKLLT